VATKRLNAIREFTEFGSGFKIAMRDLEIRGAGNLLGVEQHGHMASVGFDMYCRLLEESVQELQGKPAIERQALPVVELPVDAYIPDEYLNDPRLKMEVYKKLADVERLENLERVEEEIRDRFGPIPEALENLIGITRLRLLAYQAQVGSLQQQGDQLRIRFSNPIVWPADTLARLTRRLGKRSRDITLLDQGDLLVRIREILPVELVAILEALLWEAVSIKHK
jgi:transcription-repair coupling factor (superfamily II helicase)